MKSKNIFPIEGKVLHKDRFQKYKHKSSVIWLTGLSGAGKSTIAIELEKRLFLNDIHTYILDGDNLRNGLNSDMGFSPEDRAENIRRVAEVARLFADAGLVVITAFISPYNVGRDYARKIAVRSNIEFVEIYLKCPVEVCRKRDTKGLYEKALKGEIKDFTGINSPYEEPLTPEIVLKTNELSVENCVSRIFSFLEERIFKF